MTVTIKIPKKSIQKNIPSEKIIKSPDKSENEGISMEIIDSAEFHRANIRFIGGIPSEAIRTILKTEGWMWNPKLEIWYPKGEFARSNSYNFANMLKKAYFDK